MNEAIYTVMLVNDEGEHVLEREGLTYEATRSKMRDLQEAGFVAWVE